MALLRGVNVGKAKRVPMAEFRALLSGLGSAGVATLLNSGNAVFHATKGSSAQHAADIAAALAKELNVEVPVIVKSTQELAAIVAECPIKAEASDHPRFLVAFVQQATELPSLASLEALVVPPERFAIGSQAAYLLCANGMLESAPRRRCRRPPRGMRNLGAARRFLMSKAGEALVGKAGKRVTGRNWATVLKLQALAEDRH